MWHTELTAIKEILTPNLASLLRLCSCHLAHGPLGAVARSVGVLPAHNVSCNLWWPDDHSWCVATDIDLDSTYIGATEACVAELLANPELEVVTVSVAAGVTADSDTLNLAVAPDLPKGEH